MKAKELFTRFDFVSRYFSLRKLIAKEGRNLLLPFYHSIGEPSALPHIQHLYQPRDTQLFLDDLDVFLKYYTPIDLDQLIFHIRSGEPFKKPVFHLTFDDGLREVYEIAMPILEAKGIPATIFINSAFVDNKALFYRYKASLLVEHGASESVLNTTHAQRAQLDTLAAQQQYDFDSFLQNHTPYLTTEQIKTMLDKGFSFGGHSVNHPHYATLTEAEQLAQTNESMQFLEEQFGIQYRAFAFPFSDDGVASTFYEKAKLDISFGTAGIKRSAIPNHGQRLPMEGTSRTAYEIIKQELFYRKFVR